jgi:hypothetical protein
MEHQKLWIRWRRIGAQGSQPSQAPFIPQQMPFLPATGPPAGVAPVQATPVPDQQAPVIQPMEEPNVEGKKAGKCWKCSVDTHATKDCKVQHYCLVCDTGSHPTLRCPTLRLPDGAVMMVPENFLLVLS